MYLMSLPFVFRLHVATVIYIVMLMLISCRNKINSTKEQVKEQHAYLKQLKHNKADTEIYQQEKTVEKQLRKRQVQY